MDTIEIVKNFYNNDVASEWNRIDGRPEFLITCRFFDRYIKPGDKILDIGGGPGRYSFYLAAKGCDVTLFDLSDASTMFAANKAIELGMSIKTLCGDARVADELLCEQYDHILLMGPMYHLLDEGDRVKSIKSALKLLKPDGVIYISFINVFAGMIYYMKYKPDMVSDPAEKIFLDAILENRSFAGQAFTQAFLARQDEILPFMEQFNLEKLHLIGQESIISPCENNIMSQQKEVIEKWIDICEKVCEREDLLSWSEHLMYIGRKNDG
ncbi:MAG: class I SAM-dependent methyltransferase [Saccharofermentanales bacterium]